MEITGAGISWFLRPREKVELIKHAEQLGYHSAWTGEVTSGDQFTILTACALATSRILLGTSISPIFYRSAPTIAMATACVDEYSDGRFILGLGSGHRVQVEGEHGMPYDKPLTRLREYVDVIRGILKDGEVSYEGETINIARFELLFEPRGVVPIYLAAVNEKMLRIAGQISDGVILNYRTPEEVSKAVEYVREGAIEAGRKPEDVKIVVMLSLSISNNKDEARDRIRPGLARRFIRFPRYRNLMASYGYEEELEAVRQVGRQGDYAEALRLVPTELIDSISLVGTADECRERLQEYRQAGADIPILGPAVGREEGLPEAKRFLEACAPR